METSHRIFFKDSRRMTELAEKSVDLVVTSPPYPMIVMWDEMFAARNPRIRQALDRLDGPRAFELMHRELDAVWQEVWRVTKPGGLVCINIGDAARTVDGNFALYPNHARILSRMQDIGFTALPEILWRKQTNAPNKFMGSGMLPAGAYVTLEHEFILIFRKGGKRNFSANREKAARRNSAFFWEERNAWFSDVWLDLKGTGQNLFDNKTRSRSAAFPFELPYRLINMFSVKSDTVLAPFAGIGTTMLAAMAAGRNFSGYELVSDFAEAIFAGADSLIAHANQRIDQRLQSHLDFVRERTETKGTPGYVNQHYGFPVMTRQETALLLNEPLTVEKKGKGTLAVTYSDRPQQRFCVTGQEMFAAPEAKPPERKQKSRARQLRLIE